MTKDTAEKEKEPTRNERPLAETKASSSAATAAQQEAAANSKSQDELAVGYEKKTSSTMTEQDKDPDQKKQLGEGDLGAEAAKKEATVANLPARDIPIPTELQRSLNISIASSPGAFAQPGMNASRSNSSGSDNGSSIDEDETDYADNDHGDDLDDSSSSSPPRGNGGSTPGATAAGPPLIKATLVEENQSEDPRLMLSAPVKRASSVLAHAERWEDRTDPQYAEESSTSTSSEQEKENEGRRNHIVWWQVVLVLAALVALGVGVALAVVNARSDGSKSKTVYAEPDYPMWSSDNSSDPGDFEDDPRLSTSTFHFVSWGSLIQDCGGDAPESSMNATLNVECTGRDTMAYVYTLPYEGTTSVSCTRESDSSFSCEQQQQLLLQESNSTTPSSPVGVLVQCYQEQNYTRRERGAVGSSSDDEPKEPPPYIRASFDPISANGCSAPRKDKVEDRQTLLRRRLSEEVVNGGGIGQWLTVGRVCWEPSGESLRIQDFFPCGTGTGLPWTANSDSNGTPTLQVFCLESETCADNSSWMAAPEDTCSLTSSTWLEMKTSGVASGNECFVHHYSQEDLPDLWEVDKLQAMLLVWLLRLPNPEVALLERMKTSWEASFVSREGGDGGET